MTTQEKIDLVKSHYPTIDDLPESVLDAIIEDLPQAKGGDDEKEPDPGTHPPAP